MKQFRNFVYTEHNVSQESLPEQIAIFFFFFFFKLCPKPPSAQSTSNCCRPPTASHGGFGRISFNILSANITMWTRNFSPRDISYWEQLAGVNCMSLSSPSSSP